MLVARERGRLPHMLTKTAVKKIREAAKLSQKAFGERIGVSRCRVTHVELGDGTFRPRVVLKILAEFRTEMGSMGVLPEDLYRVG